MGLWAHSLTSNAAWNQNLRRIHRHLLSQRLLMRYCRNWNRLESLLTMVRSTPQDTSALRRDLREVVLGSEAELSVYRTEQPTSNDIGHALGVVAMVLGSRDLDSPRTALADPLTGPLRRKVKRRAGSVLMDHERTSAVCRVDSTPNGCLTFAPAQPFHHDLVETRPADPSTATGAPWTALIGFLLGELEAATAICTCVWSPGTPGEAIERYTTLIAQVEQVDTHCKQQFGPLNDTSAPATWGDTTTYTAQEQLERFVYLRDLLRAADPCWPPTPT